MNDGDERAATLDRRTRRRKPRGVPDRPLRDKPGAVEKQRSAQVCRDGVCYPTELKDVDKEI